MIFMMIKYLVTAALVVIISEVAKRNDRVGSLIASLPLVTILTLFWLKFENAGTEKISNHAYSVGSQSIRNSFVIKEFLGLQFDFVDDLT